MQLLQLLQPLPLRGEDGAACSLAFGLEKCSYAEQMGGQPHSDIAAISMRGTTAPLLDKAVAWTSFGKSGRPGAAPGGEVPLSEGGLQSVVSHVERATATTHLHY